MDPAAMDVLHELQEMEAHSSCVKVEYVVEKHKEPYLEALKIIEVSEKGRLSDRDRFLSDMKKHTKESCKHSRDMVKILVLSDFQPDVHCAVEEILEHRMKPSAEREQIHKARIVELQEQQLRKPEVQARNARREKREQLEKERAEYNRQKSVEQAEIDAINNEERNLTTAYQSSFNDLDEGIRKDEAEIEQLMVQLGRVAVSTVSTIPTVSTVTAAESSTEQPNAQVVTEQAKSLPFCTVKMKIDELVCPQFSGNLDDMSTYTGRLLQDVLANVNQSGENSSSQASSRSRSVSNKGRYSDLVSHQSVDQNDHSHVRSERTVRSNEPILTEASNNNAPTAPVPAPAPALEAPVFVAPSMPAPIINKRKESASEQMTSSTFEPKRRTLESRAHESLRESPKNTPSELLRQSFQETSRQSPRELPRKSPAREQPRQIHCEVPRKSPQNEICFTVRSRNVRSEPDLSIVKSEHPIQTSMGATPREIVSELYSRRGNAPSAFQPVATYACRQSGAGSFASGDQSTPKPSGSTSFQASKVPSSVQTPSTVPENRANKKSGDQPSASRPVQRDDDRGSRSDTDNSGRFNEQSTFDDTSFSEHSFGTLNTGNRNKQPGTSRSAQRDGDRGFQNSGADSSFEALSGFGDDSFDRSHKAASSAKPGEKQSKPFDADKSFGEFSFADSDAGAFDADTLGGNFEAADFAEGFGFDDD